MNIKHIYSLDKDTCMHLQINVKSVSFQSYNAFPLVYVFIEHIAY